MWMMTKIGFFSIVEKPKGKIQIRARAQADLEALREEVIGPHDPGLEMWKIIVTPQADYRYRIVLPRVVFENIFPEFMKLVTYNNFKHEVGKTNQHREMLYHQVWWILRQIELEDQAAETDEED